MATRTGLPLRHAAGSFSLLQSFLRDNVSTIRTPNSGSYLEKKHVNTLENKMNDVLNPTRKFDVAMYVYDQQVQQIYVFPKNSL